MTNVNIFVTEPDIKLGQACDYVTCPVALALMRQLDLLGVFVTERSVQLLRRTGGVHQISLPQTVTDWILMYDTSPYNIRKAAKPFSFELPLPYDPEAPCTTSTSPKSEIPAPCP